MSSIRCLSFAAAILFAGCGATFDVSIDSSTTIKSGGLVQNVVNANFGDFSSIDLSQSQAFKNAGVDKKHVDSVKLSSLDLVIESPEGATLEFIDDIEFFLEADGAPKKRLAFAKNIPNDSTSVALEIDDLELVPYVTAPAMNITTKTKAHAPQKDTTIKATLVFTVDPKIF